MHSSFLHLLVTTLSFHYTSSVHVHLNIILNFIPLNPSRALQEILFGTRTLVRPVDRHLGYKFYHQDVLHHRTRVAVLLREAPVQAQLIVQVTVLPLHQLVQRRLGLQREGGSLLMDRRYFHTDFWTGFNKSFLQLSNNCISGPCIKRH